MPSGTPSPTPDRPRRTGAPSKRERPRDELGRPLPPGRPNLLRMEDFDSLGVEQNHLLGRRHFNAGRFFQAHEAWEACWRQVRADPEGELFKGLSQLGAGYVHWRRGNPRGAATLLRRAAGRIAGFEPGRRGVRTDDVASAALRDADAIDRAARTRRAIPRLRPPRI